MYTYGDIYILHQTLGNGRDLSLVGATTKEKLVEAAISSLKEDISSRYCDSNAEGEDIFKVWTSGGFYENGELEALTAEEIGKRLVDSKIVTFTDLDGDKNHLWFRLLRVLT